MTAVLLELAIKSSVLIAATAAIDWRLRKRGSAATRHLVWTLAIGGLLTLPLLLLAIPRWELQVPVASSAAPPAARGPAEAGHYESGGVGRYDNKEAADDDYSEAGHDKARTPAPESHPSISAGPIVISVYLAGVALLLVRLALQQRAARRLARASTALDGPEWLGLLDECVERLDARGPVRLLRGREQTVPMTFGTRAPTILVPAAADTWSDDRRRAVLLHELAHIVRRDCATQTAAAVACAIYWLHPGVWWAATRMRREREIACDDRVVSAGTQPTDYAGHLLELAYTCVGRGTPVLAVSMARPSEIEGRLRALLDAARNRRTPALRTQLWSLVTSVVVIGMFAAMRATLVPVQAQTDQSSSNLLNASQQPAAAQRSIDAGAREIAQGRAGTWQMWVSEDGTGRLHFSDRDGSWHSVADDIGHVEGQWHSSNGASAGTMTVTRDAGTFMLEGVFKPGSGKSGVAAGTFTFAPSSTFAAEMARRGYTRPSTLDQYLLARSDIGFAFIDELSAQGYSRPDLATLVRASEHGVTLSHLRSMGRLGYRLQQVDALITQVDHGVTADFVRELRDLGFKDLPAEDLVRTRDHGVDASYIKELRTLGYNVSSMAEAIRTRDHGVDVEYVRALRQLGYRLTLEETITARDHGVDTSYIRDLAGFGYANLQMQELIRTRDHGVDPEYIRRLAALGYKGLSLEELIRLRDHGVDPEFVERLKKRSARSATPDDLVRLRDAGPITDRMVDTARRELAQLSARFALWRTRLLR